MKAIVLLRVSSNGQTKRAGADEGYSMELQRRDCHERARQLEAVVAHELVAPAESASKGLYRTLRQALEIVQAEPIDYLIVHKLDRFARDELTTFTVFAELQAAGCKLVSVRENIDDSDHGMFMMSILTAVNALESRRTATRVLDGLLQKARNGGTPMKAPLGYLNKQRWDGSNDIRTVEIASETAPLIHWAFTVYATGEYTLNELVEEMWERGLRTLPTAKRPAGKVGRSTLARILKDRYYVGVVTYRGVDYEGTHPTFIGRETFDRVQEVLRSHHAAGEKHWRHTSPLKGTVYCGLCKQRLRFTQVRGRHGGAYRYFVCASRHERAGCQMHYASEEAVEAAVARYYAHTIRFDAERVEQLEAALIEGFDRISDYRGEEVERQRRAIRKLEGHRRRLIDAHLAGAVPLELLREKQEEIAAQLAKAEAAVDKAIGSVEQAKRGLKLALKLLQKAGAAYHEADEITRRAWNQTFFTKLWIAPADDDVEVVGAELTDEFSALLADDLSRQLACITFEPPSAKADRVRIVDQRWRRRELNPRPRSRERWLLRAYPAL